MRRIAQPGPPPPERIQWVEARGRAFSFTAEAGLPLLEAMRRGFAAADFASGIASFQNAALEPFAYVMPALSNTGENAAFYSETFRPAGPARIEAAAMTFGIRDGGPFFHCHALWTEADGRRSGGHILPEETAIAEPFAIRAFGLDGAGFLAEPDPETNFKLFGPVAAPTGGAQAEARCFALRLRPNQDLAAALEDFCRERRIARARLHGGVGSIIGAHFAEGRMVQPFATEMLLCSGEIGSGDGGAPEAALDVALVDYTGGLARGRLKRGDNPVLMTMEIVLEPL
jgi:predicted DNA-binding protein with PD1-like motif